MMCPKCHCMDTKVYKTRQVTKSMVKRYHKCRYCGKNFSSTEVVNPPKANKIEDEDNYYLPDDE